MASGVKQGAGTYDLQSLYMKKLFLVIKKRNAENRAWVLAQIQLYI